MSECIIQFLYVHVVQFANIERCEEVIQRFQFHLVVCTNVPTLSLKRCVALLFAFSLCMRGWRELVSE